MKRRSLSLETSGLPVWKIHAERVLLLVWGRAILLQLAHPLVAAGVDQHSRFRSLKYGGLRRLRGTLDAMLRLTYDIERMPVVAAQINAIHDRVHGHLAEETPAFPAGTRYSAHDPELLRWVYATLIDSMLMGYERFVGPLTDEEKDTYCADSAAMERVVGAPDGFFPANLAALRDYLTGMLSSDQIVVTETARRLAVPILWPDAPLPLRLCGWLPRLASVGMLPPEVRAGYGLAWTARDERALRAATWAVRHGLPLVPAPVRHWGLARRASRTTSWLASAREIARTYRGEPRLQSPDQ